MNNPQAQSIDPIQQAVMLADLGGLTCQLNHGSWTPEDDQAVDYLILPVGPTVVHPNGVKVQEIAQHYAVPICGECAKTLYTMDKEWILVFCTKCGESHWFIRKFSTMRHGNEMIIWTTACQFCAEPDEKVGIYFQDNEEF